MKLDPGMHIGMHLVFFGKASVTHLDDKATRLEEYRFKIAFVIFVLGHLLVPSAKHDHGTTDFWGAFKDPNAIDCFNWCRYVYQNLFKSALKAREE
jgi:hypothetical protein